VSVELAPRSLAVVALRVDPTAAMGGGAFGMGTPVALGHPTPVLGRRAPRAMVILPVAPLITHERHVQTRIPAQRHVGHQGGLRGATDQPEGLTAACRSLPTVPPARNPANPGVEVKP
jgi:hypothetical protein